MFPIKNNKNLIFIFFLSILFAFSQFQFPLFSSNQNTYLLQAISNVEGSPLNLDWLSNQTNHIPLFTWLTEFIYSISPNLIYFAYGILLIILIISLHVIGSKFADYKFTKTTSVIFFLSFIVIEKYLGLLNIGSHGQHLLGRTFQPSVFGVFLLTSIALFISKRVKLSIFSLMVAAYFHPTYILHCAFLVFTYQLIQIFCYKKTIIHPLVLGLSSLTLIFPLIYFLYFTFLNEPTDILTRSREILAYDRIRLSALFEEWKFRRRTILGIFLILLAITLHFRNIKALMLVTIPFLLGASTVAFAHITDNPTATLLFGHRISVWLEPLSVSLILSKLIGFFVKINFFNFSKKILFYLSVSSIFLFSAYGLNKTVQDHILFKKNRLHIFLPSLDFNEGSLLVPLDRKLIRLNAKIPVFIEWKNHPYKASEVIEWKERNILVDAFYHKSKTNRKFIFNKITKKEKIAYILTNVDDSLENCEHIFKDEKSKVYKAEECY
jgi:hypothetical protein